MQRSRDGGVRRRFDSSVAAGLVAAVVTLSLAAIRIGRSFDYDEGYTYYFFINGGSVRRALTTQVVFNNHPMFSAIQAAAWRLGLVGESAQRLGPALCGAATVGIVVWIVARRAGIAVSALAAVTLTLNPVFIEQIRQLRGYALAALCVLVAGVAMHRSLTDLHRRWLYIQAAAMVLAVTTHTYSAFTLLVLAVASIALGGVRRDHVVTWSVAAFAALVIMSPILDDMMTNAEARGNRYASDFPVDLGRALLGWQLGAVVVSGLLVAVGAVSIARRSQRHLVAVLASASTFAFLVIALWQIVQPFDLYPRFFISVIPLLAVIAGIGAGELPRPARVVALAVVVVLLFPGARDIIDVQPTIRNAAAVVDRARAEGLTVCGRHVEPLLVYTAPMEWVQGPDDFVGCDVWVVVLRLPAEIRAAGEQHFGDRVSLGGIQIFAAPDVLDVVVPR